MGICSTNKVNDPSFIATCGADYMSVEDRNTLFESLAMKHPEVMGLFHTLSTKSETEQLRYLTEFGSTLGGFQELRDGYTRDSRNGIGVEAAIMHYVATQKSVLEKTNWTSNGGPRILSTWAPGTR